MPFGPAVPVSLIVEVKFPADFHGAVKSFGAESSLHSITRKQWLCILLQIITTHWTEHLRTAGLILN